MGQIKNIKLHIVTDIKMAESEQPQNNTTITTTTDTSETEEERTEASIDDKAEGDATCEEYTEIKEGKAKILFPKQNSVFYNNVQVFNRDLSISVIKYFIKLFHQNKKHPATEKDYEAVKYSAAVAPQAEQEGKENGVTGDDNGDTEVASKNDITIMECLSATGLRAMRYALEIPGVNRVIANDLSRNADASMLLYEHRYPSSQRVSVIDLDPYGSPTQFLDGALQAIADGGLLCVTCTDMGALCGNHGEAAYAKYGSMPLRAKYCHEMALRIVLSTLDSHAGRYKRYIEPLVSMSADFYVRVFVRVFTSASEVKRSASKKSYLFNCKGCSSFALQPVGYSIEEGNSKKFKAGDGPVVGEKCPECGFGYKIGGPVWSGPIHNMSFVDGLLASIQADGPEVYKTYSRMVGVLTLMSEELPDQPLYHVLDHLCNIIHCSPPKQAPFRSALIHAGYKVSSTHANESGFKTNAPHSVVWDILRCWVKKNPVKQRANSEHTAAHAILKREPKLEANFEEVPEATPQSKILKLSRFPVNPEADWGPKSKANQGGRFVDQAEKRRELQGKRKKGLLKAQKQKQTQCKKYKRGECEMTEECCRFSHSIDLPKNTDTNNEAVESMECSAAVVDTNS